MQVPDAFCIARIPGATLNTQYTHYFGASYTHRSKLIRIVKQSLVMIELRFPRLTRRGSRSLITTRKCLTNRTRVSLTRFPEWGQAVL